MPAASASGYFFGFRTLHGGNELRPIGGPKQIAYGPRVSEFSGGGHPQGLCSGGPGSIVAVDRLRALRPFRSSRRGNPATQCWASDATLICWPLRCLGSNLEGYLPTGTPAEFRWRSGAPLWKDRIRPNFVLPAACCCCCCCRCCCRPSLHWSWPVCHPRPAGLGSEYEGGVQVPCVQSVEGVR